MFKARCFTGFLEAVRGWSKSQGGCGGAKPAALLHITHAKAGSTWIEGILRSLFGRRVAPRNYGRPSFERGEGRIFSLFMSREDFLAEPQIRSWKRFVVLRDLRDTLISRYFSIRYSHPEDPSGEIMAQRAALGAKSVEQGLLDMMNHRGMLGTAAIQRSWIGSGELVLRYEDLISSDAGQFEEIFAKLDIRLPVGAVKAAVEANRFEKVFRRRLGAEDRLSHGRQGLPGDWRNHFTPEVAQRFHEIYGDVLIEGGFESDRDWHRLAG